MPRETERNRTPTTFRPPEGADAPPANPRTPDVAEIAVGGAGGESLRVWWTEADGLAVYFGRDVLVAGSRDRDAVTAWGRHASLLLDASIPVEPGDELEVRTPPLISAAGCIALGRRSTATQSVFALMIALTPDALSADILPRQVPMARDHARQFVIALRDAVSAT